MVDSLKNDYAGFVDSTKQEHLFQDWLGQMLIRFRPLCLFSRAAVAAAAPVLCEIINSLSEEEEMSNKIAVVASSFPWSLELLGGPRLPSLLLGSETLS